MTDQVADRRSRKGLDREFYSDRKSVREARRAVREYAEGVGADPVVVELAVSEAATNVVLHAYRDERPRTFVVIAAAERDRLLVIVRDRGIGMVPNPESPGVGLGLPIISQLADTVEMDSGPNGLTLTMTFALGS
jgi:serine/threonine-protein kinase RsbW